MRSDNRGARMPSAMRYPSVPFQPAWTHGLIYAVHLPCRPAIDAWLANGWNGTSLPLAQIVGRRALYPFCAVATNGRLPRSALICENCRTAPHYSKR